RAVSYWNRNRPSCSNYFCTSSSQSTCSSSVTFRKHNVSIHSFEYQSEFQLSQVSRGSCCVIFKIYSISGP
ncbi:unnamed protein product, partial [Allacma fusca]